MGAESHAKVGDERVPTEPEVAALMKSARDVDDSLHKKVFKERARLLIFAGVDDDSAEDNRPCIGRYPVTRRLGYGGMSQVFEAYDDELNRAVAIKLIDMSGESFDDKRRLLREAKALASVRHKNVLRVHEFGEYDGRPYLVLDLIDGPNLADWREDEEPEWREVLARYIEAGQGLVAIHAAGLVHRDFKPSNAVIARDGPVRVIDLGLVTTFASEALADDPHDDARDEETTVSDRIIGTPKYMAPEQLVGEWSARSDQFSFCYSLYEALYGVTPYPEPRRLSELLLRPQPWRPRAPPDDASPPPKIASALLRGLAFDPDDRHPTMEALLQALSFEPARSWWRPVVVAVIAVVVLVASITAYVVLYEPLGVCLDRANELEDTLASTNIDFSTLSAPYAVDTRPRLVARLESYAEDYSERYRRACYRNNLIRSGTSALEQGQQLCFANRAYSYRELLRNLVAPDERTLRHAIQSVYALPPLVACDVEAKPHSESSARSLELSNRLATIEVVASLGDTRSAQDELTRLLAELERDDNPLQPRAQAISGRLLAERGRVEEALTELEDAGDKAEALGDDESVAHLLAGQAGLLVTLKRFSEATRRLNTARAKLARLASVLRPRYELRQAILTARVANIIGDPPDALERLASLVALDLGRHKNDELTVIEAYDVLGRGYLEREDLANALTAFGHAHDREESIFGPSHPEHTASVSRRCELVSTALSSSSSQAADLPHVSSWLSKHNCRQIEK